MFPDKAAGREETLFMINAIADTYESIEGMIADIDKKHIEYINASIDRIRYQINADRSVKGKLIAILKHTEEEKLWAEMNRAVDVYRHSYMDTQSLYNRVKRTVKTEGKPLPLQEKEENQRIVDGFLNDVKKQYSNKKIDAYIDGCFGTRQEFVTEDVEIETSEDFILFLLGTLRGREKSAKYQVEFDDGNIYREGYSLPRAHFVRKKVPKDV